jgi:hypothetical protein
MRESAFACATSAQASSDFNDVLGIGAGFGVVDKAERSFE